jgi:hypothetical protein
MNMVMVAMFILQIGSVVFGPKTNRTDRKSLTITRAYGSPYHVRFALSERYEERGSHVAENQGDKPDEPDEIS